MHYALKEIRRGKNSSKKKKNQTTWLTCNDIFSLSIAIIPAAKQYFPSNTIGFLFYTCKKKYKKDFYYGLLVYLLIVYVGELPYITNKLAISFQIKTTIKGKMSNLCRGQDRKKSRGSTPAEWQSARHCDLQVVSFLFSQ